MLPQMGAVLSLLLGVMGALLPTQVEKFVSIKAVGSIGEAEIRATYGGFFLGLSLFALVSQQEIAFLALGCGWLGAALIRFLSLFKIGFTVQHFAGVIFEFFIGVLCISSLF